ncbi:uncharacterized protein LOC130747760 [Lotus japonicus]|uniref:uncharacterized protein LOC130747760 n=1 Tax=Lotus japonicus TaxID=34305 RepID=UPI002587EBD9|nr:uncharacterized protein LOC130747760 [Lotus japonicus]
MPNTQFELPTLVLQEQNFSSDFVFWLLTLRDDSVALHGLDVKHLGFIRYYILERVVNYAVSHNVQRLGLTVICDNEHVPQCIFSCQTLTSLKLTVHTKSYFSENTLFPKSLNLPALTSLHIGHFAFRANGNDRAEPFSSLNRLNSLIIQNCTLSDAHILYISSATLTNLTVHNHTRDLYSIELSSPNLSSFSFTGVPLQQLSGSNLSSLEQVNIDAEIRSVDEANVDLETSLNYPTCPLILLSWLVELTNIKSLTVSARTLQVLFLIPHLLELKLTSLSSLKSLKVKQVPLSPSFISILRTAKLRRATTKTRKAIAKLKRAIKEEMSTSIPDGVVDFLLQNSPSAKVDIIDCTR